MDGDTLSVPVPERGRNIGAKTLGAFGWLLGNLEFDFLYRTNISSYLHLPRLLDRLPPSGGGHVYAGYRGVHQGQEFASGSGYLLSRSVVRTVWENRDHWNHGLVDDVALADLMQRLHIARLTELPRRDVSSLRSVDEMSRADLNQHFHFRCKTKPYREAIGIMHRLHQRLQER